MEDLKSTIDNTNKHINDLKLARNKINERILSGGGTIANTISEVPDAIDKMLKENYKKIAVLTLNKEFKSNTTSGIKTFTVDLSGINFTPTKGFLKFKYKISEVGNYFSKQHLIEIGENTSFPANYFYNWNYEINIYQVKIKDKTLEFNVSIYFGNGSSLSKTVDIKLEEVILIE